jgi:hypothetical protein
MKLRPGMKWRQVTMRPGRARGWSWQTQCGRLEDRRPSEKKKCNKKKMKKKKNKKKEEENKKKMMKKKR